MHSTTTDNNDGYRTYQTSVLELLQLEALLRLGIVGPDLEVIHGRFGAAQERLAVELGLVLPRLEHAAEDDELGPPLGIGLEDGIDGVGGGDVLGREGAEELGEDPADGRKHGGAAVGELGAAGPVDGDVVTEAEGIEL